MFRLDRAYSVVEAMMWCYVDWAEFPAVGHCCYCFCSSLMI